MYSQGAVASPMTYTQGAVSSPTQRAVVSQASSVGQPIATQYVAAPRYVNNPHHLYGPTSTYVPATVQDAWQNHFDAFGAQDVPKIMLDYDAASVVSVYNNVDGDKKVFKGIVEIRSFFTQLFKDLFDLATLEAPVVDVDEMPDGIGGQVFLVWSCPGCGFHTATDTFVFSGDKKIKYQNIVITKDVPYAPQTIQEAWQNHFDAFGSQDMAKLMLDYDDTSKVSLYNNVGGHLHVFNGLVEVQSMFEGLFHDLSDLSTLTAPVVDVAETEAGGQVFLVWNCPGCGYDTATDTFVFGSDKKIKFQNIVITKSV